MLKKLILSAFVLASSAHAENAGPTTGPSAETFLSSLKTERVRGGYVGAVLGATILVLPLTLRNSNSTTKLVYSLAGVTVVLNGIKQIITPSQTENVLETLESLKAAHQLSPEAERAFYSSLARTARIERQWGAAFAMVGGAVSLVAASGVSDSSFKTFTYVLGGFSLVGGLRLMTRPSKLEKFAAGREVAHWSLGPAVLVASTPTPGMALNISY